MPKTNWAGAEEPTIKNFYKIDNIDKIDWFSSLLCTFKCKQLHNISTLVCYSTLILGFSAVMAPLLFKTRM